MGSDPHFGKARQSMDGALILLIGGTSETAPLAAALAAAGYAVLVSTATAAPLALAGHPGIRRRIGRLDAAGLAALARDEGIGAIVDAAHPYAVAAHAAAAAAAEGLGIPCLAFRRPAALTAAPVHRPAGDAVPSGEQSPPPPDRPAWARRSAGPAAAAGSEPAAGAFPELPPIQFAADHGEAARLACASGRPVLLTTGSRNLAPYVAEAHRTGVPLAARVLDAPESLAACREAGIPPERVIAARGPFGLAENLSAIDRFGIGVLVTKESGLAGGLSAKLAAAAAAGCLVVLVRRPALPATGLHFTAPEPLVQALRSLLPPRGKFPCPEPDKFVDFNPSK